MTKPDNAPYYEADGVTLLHGDSMELLKGLESDSIDCVVTDPPYELTSISKPRPDLSGKNNHFARIQAKMPAPGFMGKEWDGTGIQRDPCFWSEVMRVLKPGGHLLSFGGTRTSHRMVCAIEDAGFEIRDSIMWVYASGFPKSLDVSKQIDKAAGAEREVVGKRKQPSRANSMLSRSTQAAQGYRPDGAEFVQFALAEIDITAPATDAARQWQGWGTATKPAHEPICVARKPLSEKNVAANVLKHGTGAINIDACRIQITDALPAYTVGAHQGKGSGLNPYFTRENQQQRAEAGENPRYDQSGRFPANIMFDESAAEELDRQSGVLTSGSRKNPELLNPPCPLSAQTTSGGFAYKKGGLHEASSGGASRFFYVAKPCQAERNAGCDGLEELTVGDGRQTPIDNAFQRGKTPRRNSHPTVKPVSLMRQLVKLVCPTGGTVLDPFTGSGTTGIAAVCEGFRFVGMDMTEEYIQIAAARIAYAQCNSGLFDVMSEESAQIDAQEAMAL